jgi:hypothetical protein
MFPEVIAWSEYRYADERLVFGNDVVQKVKKQPENISIYMLGMEGAFGTCRLLSLQVLEVAIM